MFKSLAILALLLIVHVNSLGQIARELIGKYQMEVQGGDVLELRSDGTASIAGEETRWSVKGRQLTVGTDVMQYELQGARLLVMLGSVQVGWRRVGTVADKTSAMERATGQSQATELIASSTAQDAQARQVLTHNAWCSFTYNKVSGTSTTRKVVFRPDGVMTVNGGAETYSAGYGGTYAGQSNNANAMRWKLENLRLLVDDKGGSGYQDIGLTATANSNGAIILKAAGREYSMCR